MTGTPLVAICLVCTCLCTTRCLAQAEASQVASCFESLGGSRILNEMMVVEATGPKLVALAGAGSSMEIYLFSTMGDRCHLAWHLAKLPPSIEVIDPRNLKIEYTDDGPLIMLHGCARHLCGGKGSAGAFTYSINSGRLCTVLANWNSRENFADISYSAPRGSPTRLEKALLETMLRAEGY